jgi:iron(III) transport system ATP-binding protein
LTNEAHLTISSLHLSYGKVAVLNGVSLNINKGMVVALRGESGCGKTSLLRCIAGLEVPSEGRIVCNGRVLNGPSVFVRPENRHIGLIFQGNALFPHMRVQDNLAFGLHGTPRGEKENRIRVMLKTLGLEGLDHRYPNELSGGQQQRVALGRSLITEPDVLLMDEPFSDLDQGTKDELRERVKEVLKGAGITTIVVSHHADDISSMADAVHEMEKGRILGS